MSELEKMVARVRVLLADQEDQEFTDAEIIAELNAANLELNDELGYYVRSESLPIIEGQLTYELPRDSMKLKRLQYDGPRGDELSLWDKKAILQGGLRNIVAIRDGSADSFSLSEGIYAETSGGGYSEGTWSE